MIDTDQPLGLSSPLHDWFELSYASFLTVPRLVMEAMPQDWQRQMADLLQELDDTYDWRPKSGRYWVRLRDAQGRFSAAPLCYRHGRVEHLRKGQMRIVHLKLRDAVGQDLIDNRSNAVSGIRIGDEYVPLEDVLYAHGRDLTVRLWDDALPG